MDKGSIHIYCGEGKGKTTAAIGQGIREASQGRSVIIIQFMKERNAEGAKTAMSLHIIHTIDSFGFKDRLV